MQKLRKGGDEVPKVFRMQNKFILIIFWAILAHTNVFFIARCEALRGREALAVNYKLNPVGEPKNDKPQYQPK